ncbi:MAG TPA: glycine cleavage system protein GcvH [Spirochaetales bacterium]|nr:glycine cleavage system protein GcvH [Spirochaetia bacterium]HPE36971.1 glycine cleavage system protein GcvH [Spirochaetales bacterium]
MNIDKNARYAASHEWARKEGSDFVTGISDHAQHSLGDIVFVELPAVGKTIKKGEAFGVVESVKAASDLYMPVSGTITAVNDALSGDPALVNREPYAGGWMIKYTAANPSEFDAMLSPEAYEAEAGKE